MHNPLLFLFPFPVPLLQAYVMLSELQGQGAVCKGKALEHGSRPRSLWELLLPLMYSCVKSNSCFFVHKRYNTHHAHQSIFFFFFSFKY